MKFRAAVASQHQGDDDGSHNATVNAIIGIDGATPWFPPFFRRGQVMSPEDIKKFQAELEAQGEQTVRDRLAGNAWNEARAPFARDWLRAKEQARDDERRDTNAALREREIAAGERSALATERAATAAETSAWWAKVAVGISILALLVAAYAAWVGK